MSPTFTTMPALSKVVSGVKRRITVNTSSLSDDHVQPLPPDLRRWSDFMNPFPPVSPGGYTKYYLIHQSEEIALPFTSPSLSQSHELSSSRSAPPTSTLFPTPSSSRHNSTKRGLPTIPESSSETARTQVARHPKGSLRRRKRRLLRTPSVERDFGVNSRSFFQPNTPLEQCESISSTQSTLSHVSHISSSSSTDSHSSESSTSTISDYPLTPADDDDANSNCAHDDHFVEGKKGIEAVPHDLFRRPERPQSWSSYITARTEFSES